MTSPHCSSFHPLWSPSLGSPYLEVFGTAAVLCHITDGQHASHRRVAKLLQMLMDEPVKAYTQLSQHSVHIFSIHRPPYTLHLLTHVGTYLRACLGTHRKNTATSCQMQMRTNLEMTNLILLTVVYCSALIALFSSSGLKSVFFCSVTRMYFIWPIMQFSVLNMINQGRPNLPCCRI